MKTSPFAAFDPKRSPQVRVTGIVDRNDPGSREVFLNPVPRPAGGVAVITNAPTPHFALIQLKLSTYITITLTYITIFIYFALTLVERITFITISI